MLGRDESAAPGAGGMTSDKGLLERVMSRGEEFFGQLSGQLMANPQFVKAMERAWQGKAAFDQAVGRVLRQMNVPSRREFERALERIEALERELGELKGASRPKPRRRRRPAAAE